MSGLNRESVYLRLLLYLLDRVLGNINLGLESCFQCMEITVFF